MRRSHAASRANPESCPPLLRDGSPRRRQSSPPTRFRPHRSQDLDAVPVADTIEASKVPAGCRRDRGVLQFQRYPHWRYVYSKPAAGGLVDHREDVPACTAELPRGSGSAAQTRRAREYRRNLKLLRGGHGGNRRVRARRARDARQEALERRVQRCCGCPGAVWMCR